MDRLSGTEYREAFADAAMEIAGGADCAADCAPEHLTEAQALAWRDAFAMFDPGNRDPGWPAAEISSPATKRRWFREVMHWLRAGSEEPPPEPEQFCRSVVTLTKADALEVRPRDWLVPDLIERESLAMLFGQPGCGKSFLAIDWAARIAAGEPWRGQAVQSGPVIYIAAEGQSGLPRRLQAWQQHTGASLGGAPLLIAGQPVDLADDSARGQFADAVDAGGVGLPALVVVDTLARCFTGDEANNAAMAAFIRGCDDLRARWGCAVLLVHHSGHGRQDRARGASGLFGALDAAYRLEQRPGGLVLVCVKAKDFAPPDPIGLRLVTVGESAAIAVAEDFGPDEAEPPQRGKWPGVVLANIEGLADEDGRADLSAVREACQRDGLSVRSTWHRTIETLRASGEITVSPCGSFVDLP